jgi:hypothetical protein
MKSEDYGILARRQYDIDFKLEGHVSLTRIAEIPAREVPRIIQDISVSCIVAGC